MQRAIFRSFGRPADVIELETFEHQPPGPGEVAVRVQAAPINPADFLLITGTHAFQPPLPARVGIEGAGVVTAVGEGVHDLAPGALVVLPAGGCWAEEVTCAADAVYPMPAGMDPRQAAMLSVNPVTALCLLTRIRDVVPGEWILQNAAGSAVGKLVVRMARDRGIRTVNVVRRQESAAELERLGADVVLVGEEDLARRVAAATGNASVLLALDAIAGASAGRLVECLGFGGTLVTYGLLSGAPIQVPTARIVFEQIVVRGFTRLWTLRQMGRDQGRAFLRELAGMVMDGRLTSQVEAAYPLSEIRAALRHAEQEGRDGKVMLVMDPAGQ